MSAVADLRVQATAKRAAGLDWEASRLEMLADRINRATVQAPITITLLVDLYDQAAADVERESEFKGSSYDEAVARRDQAFAALVELGAL